MKYLILTLVFLALGACSPKETDFNKSSGTTKSSSTSSQSENGAGQGTSGAENQGTGSEGETAATPDKVINVGGDYSGGYVSNARGDKKFPDVEGTQRFRAVCTHKTNKADVRTISVIDTREGHCANVYKKFGKKYIKGYAKNDMNVCTVIYTGIVENLRNSDFFECEGDIPEDIGGGETGSDDDGSGTGSTSVGEDTEDDGTGDTGGAESGGDVSDGENGGDPSAPRFSMDISTFLELEQKAVRMYMNCKNGDDKVFVSIIDTVEGPCGVVHKENDDEQGTLETVGIEDMSRCDRGFNTLVRQLIRDGFGCNGSGSSAADETAEE